MGSTKQGNYLKIGLYKKRAPSQVKVAYNRSKQIHAYSMARAIHNTSTLVVPCRT